MQQHHGHGGQGQGQQGIGRGPPEEHHLEGQHRDLAQQEHQQSGALGHGPQQCPHEPGQQHEGRCGDHDAPQGLAAQESAYHHPGPGEERIDSPKLRGSHAGKAEGGAALPHPHPAKEQTGGKGGQFHEMLHRVRSRSLSAHGLIVDDGRGPFSANPAQTSPFLPDRKGGSRPRSAPFFPRP